MYEIESNLSFPTNETSNITPSSRISCSILLSSGIIVTIFAVLTVVGNGLLLLAIYKDPYHSFRIPPTVFVVGLAVADFLTGAVVAPAFVHSRFSTYLLRRNETSCCCKLDDKLLSSKATNKLSFLTMNASYLILLFLTWSQFSAIHFPHRHRVVLTTRKVAACVISVWVYLILFSLLQLVIDEHKTFMKLDFYMHTLVFLILLTVAYCCLYVAYKTQIQRIVAVTTERCTETERRESMRIRRRSERQFTIVTLVLGMFIIIWTLPSTVLQFISVYFKELRSNEGIALLLARELSSDILFLKFALDPFVYCWRLVSYRKALKTIMPCVKTPVEPQCFVMSVKSVMEGLDRKTTSVRLSQNNAFLVVNR